MSVKQACESTPVALKRVLEVLHIPLYKVKLYDLPPARGKKTPTGKVYKVNLYDDRFDFHDIAEHLGENPANVIRAAFLLGLLKRRRSGRKYMPVDRNGAKLLVCFFICRRSGVRDGSKGLRFPIRDM